jgi:hypothetical protein
VSSQLRGNDVDHIVCRCFPCCWLACYFARRGSLRGLLVWLGGLWYVPSTTICSTLFGASFNEFFLVYTALFALSTLALIFTLIARIDAKAQIALLLQQRAHRCVGSAVICSSGLFSWVGCGSPNRSLSS